ncbi:unnamed protein product [Discosporangium mesarthrocarpum]
MKPHTLCQNTVFNAPTQAANPKLVLNTEGIETAAEAPDPLDSALESYIPTLAHPTPPRAPGEPGVAQAIEMGDTGKLGAVEGGSGVRGGEGGDLNEGKGALGEESLPPPPPAPASDSVPAEEKGLPSPVLQKSVSFSEEAIVLDGGKEGSAVDEWVMQSSSGKWQEGEEEGEEEQEEEEFFIGANFVVSQADGQAQVSNGDPALQSPKGRVRLSLVRKRAPDEKTKKEKGKEKQQRAQGELAVPSEDLCRMQVLATPGRLEAGLGQSSGTLDSVADLVLELLVREHN